MNPVKRPDHFHIHFSRDEYLIRSLNQPFFQGIDQLFKRGTAGNSVYSSIYFPGIIIYSGIYPFRNEKTDGQAEEISSPDDIGLDLDQFHKKTEIEFKVKQQAASVFSQFSDQHTGLLLGLEIRCQPVKTDKTYIVFFPEYFKQIAGSCVISEIAQETDDYFECFLILHVELPVFHFCSRVDFPQSILPRRLR